MTCNERRDFSRGKPEAAQSSVSWYLNSGGKDDEGCGGEGDDDDGRGDEFDNDDYDDGWHHRISAK